MGSVVWILLHILAVDGLALHQAPEPVALTNDSISSPPFSTPTRNVSASGGADAQTTLAASRGVMMQLKESAGTLAHQVARLRRRFELPPPGILLGMIGTVAVTMLCCAGLTVVEGSDFKFRSSASSADKGGGARSRPVPPASGGQPAAKTRPVPPPRNLPPTVKPSPQAAGQPPPAKTLEDSAEMPTILAGASLAAAAASTGHSSKKAMLSDVVINSPGGLTLGIPLQLKPSEQDLVVAIRETVTSAAMVRCTVAERGAECGIFVEDARRRPVGFVDTSNALSSTFGRRHAILRQADRGGSNSRGPPFGVLFLDPEDPTMLIGRRGEDMDSLGEPLLSAQVSSQGVVGMIIDMTNTSKPEFLAKKDSASSSASSEQYSLRVEQGCDAGLAVCVALAAQKLQ